MSENMIYLYIIVQFSFLCFAFWLGMSWQEFAEKRKESGSITEKITFACPEYREQPQELPWPPVINNLPTLQELKMQLADSRNGRIDGNIADK